MIKGVFSKRSATWFGQDRRMSVPHHNGCGHPADDEAE